MLVQSSSNVIITTKSTVMPMQKAKASKISRTNPADGSMGKHES